MANRPGADDEGTLFALDGAKMPAGGTGLLGAEAVGLLFQKRGESPFGHASGGGPRDLLHRVEIDLGARAFLTESVPGNDFAPSGSQFTDFLEVFGGEVPTRHDLSCLVLAWIGNDIFLLSFYSTKFPTAK